MAKDDFGDFSNDMFSEFDMDAPAEPTLSSSGKVLAVSKTLIKSTGAGVISGVKNELRDKFANTASVYDEVASTVDDFVSLKDDAIKELGPIVNTMKQVTLRTMPFAKRLIPTKIYDKLKNYLTETIEQSEKSAAQQEAEAQQNTINESLGEVFGAQAAADQERDVRAANDKIIDRQMSNAKFKTSMKSIGRLDRQLTGIGNFMTGTFTAYMKKSLELKYQHLFVARDTYKAVSVLAQVAESRLNKIMEFSGLQDAAKSSNGKMLRDRIGKMSSFQDFDSNFRTNMMKNAKDMVMSPIRTLGTLVGMGDAMSSMLGMTGQKPLGPVDVISTILKVVGWGAGKMGMKKTLDQKGNRFMVDTIEKKMRSIMTVGKLKLSEKADSIRGNGTILGWLANLVPSAKQNKTIGNALLQDPSAPTPFDALTRASIVEVIPRHLERIGKFTEGLARSIAPSANYKDVTYNIHQRKLTSLSEAKEDVISSIYGSKENRAYSAKQAKQTMYNAYLVTNKVDTAEGKNKDTIKLLEAQSKGLEQFRINSGINGKLFNLDEIREYLQNEKVSEYISATFSGIANPLDVAAILYAGCVDKDGNINSNAVTDLRELTIEAINSLYTVKAFTEWKELAGQSHLLSGVVSKKWLNVAGVHKALTAKPKDFDDAFETDNFNLKEAKKNKFIIDKAIRRASLEGHKLEGVVRWLGAVNFATFANSDFMNETLELIEDSIKYGKKAINKFKSDLTDFEDSGLSIAGFEIKKNKKKKPKIINKGYRQLGPNSYVVTVFFPEENKQEVVRFRSQDLYPQGEYPPPFILRASLMKYGSSIFKDKMPINLSDPAIFDASSYVQPKEDLAEEEDLDNVTSPTSRGKGISALVTDQSSESLSDVVTHTIPSKLDEIIKLLGGKKKKINVNVVMLEETEEPQAPVAKEAEERSMFARTIIEGINKKAYEKAGIIPEDKDVSFADIKAGASRIGSRIATGAKQFKQKIEEKLASILPDPEQLIKRLSPETREPILAIYKEAKEGKHTSAWFFAEILSKVPLTEADRKFITKLSDIAGFVSDPQKRKALFLRTIASAKRMKNETIASIKDDYQTAKKEGFFSFSKNKVSGWFNKLRGTKLGQSAESKFNQYTKVGPTPADRLKYNTFIEEHPYSEISFDEWFDMKSATADNAITANVKKIKAKISDTIDQVKDTDPSSIMERLKSMREKAVIKAEALRKKATTVIERGKNKAAALIANVSLKYEGTAESVFHSDFRKFAELNTSLIDKIARYNSALGAIAGGVGNAVGGIGRGIGSAVGGISRGLYGLGGSTVGAIGNVLGGLLNSGIVGSALKGIGYMGKGVGYATGGLAKGYGYLAGGLGKGVGYATGGLAKGAGYMFGLGGSDKVKKTGGWFGPKFVDIYIKDNIEIGKPLLSAKEQEEGIYFADGTLVKRTSEIKAPVFKKGEDGTPRCLITQQDLSKGLVDAKGTVIGITKFEFKNFNSMLKASGLKGMLALGGLKAVAGTLGVLGGGLNLIGSLLGLGAKGLRGGGKVAGSALGRLFGFDNIEHKKYQVNHLSKLDRIITILEKAQLYQFTKDIIEEKAEERAEKEAKDEENKEKSLDASEQAAINSSRESARWGATSTASTTANMTDADRNEWETFNANNPDSGMSMTDWWATKELGKSALGLGKGGKKRWYSKLAQKGSILKTKATRGLTKAVGRGLSSGTRLVTKGVGGLASMAAKAVPLIGAGIGSAMIKGVKLLPNVPQSAAALGNTMIKGIGKGGIKVGGAIGAGSKAVSSGVSKLASTVPAAGKLVTKASGALTKLTAGGGRLMNIAGKPVAKLGSKAAALAARGGLAGAKLIPGIGWVLAAGMAAYDGYEGWNNAGEIMDKEEDDLTMTDKGSAALGNILTMGFAPKVGASIAKYSGLGTLTGVVGTGVAGVSKGLGFSDNFATGEKEKLESMAAAGDKEAADILKKKSGGFWKGVGGAIMGTPMLATKLSGSIMKNLSSNVKVDDATLLDIKRKAADGDEEAQAWLTRNKKSTVGSAAKGLWNNLSFGLGGNKSEKEVQQEISDKRYAAKQSGWKLMDGQWYDAAGKKRKDPGASATEGPATARAMNSVAIGVSSAFNWIKRTVKGTYNDKQSAANELGEEYQRFVDEDIDLNKETDRKKLLLQLFTNNKQGFDSKEGKLAAYGPQAEKLARENAKKAEASLQKATVTSTITVAGTILSVKELANASKMTPGEFDLFLDNKFRHLSFVVKLEKINIAKRDLLAYVGKVSAEEAKQKIVTSEKENINDLTPEELSRLSKLSKQDVEFYLEQRYDNLWWWNRKPVMARARVALADYVQSKDKSTTKNNVTTAVENKPITKVTEQPIIATQNGTRPTEPMVAKPIVYDKAAMDAVVKKPVITPNANSTDQERPQIIVDNSELARAILQQNQLTERMCNLLEQNNVITVQAGKDTNTRMETKAATAIKLSMTHTNNMAKALAPPPKDRVPKKATVPMYKTALITI